MNNRKYHTDPEELLRQGKEIMSSTDDVRFHFRVFSVNMVLSGLPASQISKLAGVSKMTVSSWVKIDDEKGFDALKIKRAQRSALKAYRRAVKRDQTDPYFRAKTIRLQCLGWTELV